MSRDEMKCHKDYDAICECLGEENVHPETMMELVDGLAEDEEYVVNFEAQTEELEENEGFNGEIMEGGAYG